MGTAAPCIGQSLEGHHDVLRLYSFMILQSCCMGLAVNHLVIGRVVTSFCPLLICLSKPRLPRMLASCKTTSRACHCLGVGDFSFLLGQEQERERERGSLKNKRTRVQSETTGALVVAETATHVQFRLTFR
jgi:hypothetical protein